MAERTSSAELKDVSMQVDSEAGTVLADKVETVDRCDDHEAVNADTSVNFGDDASKREGAEAPKFSAAEVSTEKLTSIIEKVCIGGTGYPATGRDGAIVTTVTSALSWDIRALLYTLYKTRRSSIRWVKSSQQLDQEEALACVLADLCGYDLLPEEARKVGEQARLAAVTYKGKPPGAKGAKPKVPPADQALKDQASKAKYAARAAADKDPELAAELEQRLADIDAVLAADRDRLGRTEVQLPWPSRNSVVRDRPAPKLQSPGSKLKGLRMAAAKAEEALLVADCDRVASKRELERAQETLAQVCEEMSAVSRAQVWAPLETPQSELEAEWQWWVEAREAAAANSKAAGANFREAQEGFWKAEDAAKEARWAVEAEEEAQSSERRDAEAKAAREAAEIERLQAQLARLKTQSRLYHHAAEVWGPGSVSKPAAKVFSLVGCSAENVRALDSQVSQQVTSSEERIKLNRLPTPNGSGPDSIFSPPPSPPPSPPNSDDEGLPQSPPPKTPPPRLCVRIRDPDYTHDLVCRSDGRPAPSQGTNACYCKKCILAYCRAAPTPYAHHRGPK